MEFRVRLRRAPGVCWERRGRTKQYEKRQSEGGMAKGAFATMNRISQAFAPAREQPGKVGRSALSSIARRVTGGRQVGLRHFQALIMIALAVSACAPTRQTVVPTRVPTAAYDDLYPYYVELCAVSQIRADFADYGGSPGHAVMWLKGACIDKSEGFTGLRVCGDGEVDLSNPENGVGISVNKTLKNANWLAFPGRSLFFHGGLQPDERLTAERAAQTIKAAIDSGAFEGVSVHDQYRPEEHGSGTMLRFLASETLGTDFALTFGRTAFCARVPMQREQMSKVTDYLTSLNRQYASGDTDYNWSGYSDNCVHAVTNALAAGGVWPAKSVNTVKLLQMFSLAIPANEVINLANRTNRFPIESFARVYDDESMRESLRNDDWIPARHGALLSSVPVHQNNDLYDTALRMFVLQGPLKAKSKSFVKLLDDPRFTELEANLDYYRERYREIVSGKPSGLKRESATDDYERVRLIYYDYIAQQLSEVERMRARVRAGSPDGAGAAPAR
jgi:hypothetical protein